MTPMSPTLQRILFAVLVVVGLAGVIFAFTRVSTDDPDSVAVGDTGPVERLIPPRDAEILRQEPVGVDLNPGWTGILQVNGVEIPEDQLNTVAATGEITYTVGPGKAVERFQGGQNCVTAVVWRVELSRQDARELTWCFDVT